MSGHANDPGTQGVLLVNLGSPAAPTTAAVRRFLDEFLGDPLVVDVNPFFWYLLRKLVILPFRGPKSAALYRTIWTEEGSPLIVRSERLRAALAREVDGPVALGMRYGEPSIAHAIDELVERGACRLLLVALFPQASRTTTGTVERAVRRVLARRGDGLELEVLPPYYADPGYLSALAGSVRAATAGRTIDQHLFSFHGLPVRYVEAGDPYREHCEATARGLARELGLGDEGWALGYQSRFGREPWLEPDTAELAVTLAREEKRVAVTCPGFATECLETLEEIGERLVHDFRVAGGEELVVVPCLDDDAAWVSALARLTGKGSA